MRKIILLFLLQCLPLAIFAQGNIEKRIVYLWDVTYSMHGGRMGGKSAQEVIVAGKPFEVVEYNPKYDIYDRIIDKLIADIESQNARTEIVVIPFNDKPLKKDVWRKMATTDGKQYIEEKIRNYCNKAQTHTYFDTPLKFAMDEIFIPDCPNVLKFLSDGTPTLRENNEEDKKKYHEFCNLLDHWCDYAEEKKVQGYYFVLTEQALSPDLEVRLEKSCFKILRDNPSEPIFELPDCNVKIQTTHHLRVFEDYEEDITLPLYMSNGELKDDAKIHVSIQENDYIELEQDVVITNQTSQLVLKPTFKKSRETMMQELPTATYTKLQLKFAKLNDGSNLVLENTSSTLLLVNRKMKSMQITIK